MPSKYQTRRTAALKQRNAEIKEVEQTLFKYKPMKKTYSKPPKQLHAKGKTFEQSQAGEKPTDGRKWKTVELTNGQKLIYIETK